VGLELNLYTYISLAAIVSQPMCDMPLGDPDRPQRRLLIHSSSRWTIQG
jgi:hypothetical protein